jgi:hypothetical protein
MNPDFVSYMVGLSLGLLSGYLLGRIVTRFYK